MPGTCVSASRLALVVQPASSKIARRVQAVDRQARGQGVVGQSRLAAHHLGMAGPLRRRARIEVRRTFGTQRIVALAEEAGIRPGPANGLAPAKVARQVHVIGQVAHGGAEIFADRAHARRIGVAGADDVRQHGLITAVARQRIVRQPPRWCSERTIAVLCIHWAMPGRCSQIWMPGTLVLAGRNSPRISTGAFGFKSTMSCVAAPPSR